MYMGGLYLGRNEKKAVFSFCSSPPYITGGLTLGISKVFQISSKSSHKIQLILAILTVLYTFLYLLWGTRTGICHVFVYLLFLSNPLGELGCIIHRWKGMNEEIAASLES